MEDIIIRGGEILDGTGRPAFRADLAVRGEKIAAIGDLSGIKAKKELDARGLAVAPGFIDAHAHSDTAFLRHGSCASKIYQGITTEISGNCGSSPFPCLPERTGDDPWDVCSFEDFLRKFQAESCAMATNQAMLVGHGSLRSGVMGYEDRPATPRETEEMKRLLRRDLESGAWGLSLGLEYAPGFFANAEELNQLGGVVRQYDGVVACHMRSEGRQIREALQELLNVGRSSGVHVHVSHLKLDFYTVHGRAAQVWDAIEQARREGVRVTADLYPYTASCTTLTIRTPRWCQEGGEENVVRHLAGPRRQEILDSLRFHYFNAERAETCLFSDDAGLWPEIVGKTLRYVAEELLHTADYAEAAAEVLTRTKGRAWCIFFVMSEEDMLYFLSRDTSIGSDGRALSGDPQLISYRPHPRYFAALSEFFRIAREKQLCPLEEAVRRVTSLTADTFGLRDRGRLLPGLTADVTVFDPQAIGPRSTYLDPVRLSRGVLHMLVNGGVAMEDGAQTDLRAGRFLRKPR